MTNGGFSFLNLVSVFPLIMETENIIILTKHYSSPLPVGKSKQHRGKEKRKKKRESTDSKIRKQLIITANAFESLITK